MSQYYIFYCIFYQINAAFMSIRNLFFFYLTDFLNSKVNVIKKYFKSKKLFKRHETTYVT